MADLIVTQITFVLCMAIFGRLFTFRRRGLSFHRLKSCLAWVVMSCSAGSALYILLGELVMPAEALPLVILLAVFTGAVWRAQGNLAGVLRPEEPAWSGVDRRKSDEG